MGGGKGGGGGSDCQKRQGEDSRSPGNPNGWPILIAALLVSHVFMFLLFLPACSKTSWKAFEIIVLC